MPLSGMLSDWTENFCTWILLLGYPYVPRTAVLVESVCTTLKFTFLGLSFVSAVVLLLIGPAGK